MSTLSSAIDAAASALDAQRARMEVAISNLANAESTDPATGQPYRRRSVVLESTPGDTFDRTFSATGVRVSQVIEDQAPFERRYEPGHANADADGYVALPNVNVEEEMVDMLSSARAYQANLTAITVVRETIAKALELAR